MTAFERTYQTILDRRAAPQTGSYTNYLFQAGLDKILKKVGEECAEVLIAAKNEKKEPLVEELADLAFHAAVLMAQANVTPADIAAELDKRAKKTGNLKPTHATDKNT
jgi:phosphoribosyl-ATP pyrophosphohydrolase